MKITTLPVIALLLLAGCSSSDPQPVNDQPLTIGTANTAQVQYPHLTATGEIPTLYDVFLTNRDSYWSCAVDFGGADYAQFQMYFYADGTGESHDNFGEGIPSYFTFNWSGQQSLSIVAEHDSITIFNFNYRTDPAEVLGIPEYEFLANHSQGDGLVLCSKRAGQWESV